MLSNGQNIKWVECPRDAMQGWPSFIPTSAKIEYINQLLQVGFDTLDFGSFVSPKAIPQMADTKDVLKGLKLDATTTKLLAIVANLRGATEAAAFDEIACLGFPFSISPTFQLRNTNSTITDSIQTVSSLQTLCMQNKKQLVVYLSMGFGNPYGDPYDEAVLATYCQLFKEMGVQTIAIADTVGVASPQQIEQVLNAIIPAFPMLQIGVHLHSTIENWKDKVDAALRAGCTRFDGALKGIGGCPMAGNDLVGNLDSELVLPYLKSLNKLLPLNEQALQNSSVLAASIFHH
ncbi:MAG: hypothetical protein RLY16_611 [Bacteroidota bacterium]